MTIVFRANDYYLNNFPQRQVSGCYSEVNILVLSEITTKSVSMNLRRSTILKGRQQEPKNVKGSESITVLLSDTDSSKSESIEEIIDQVSVVRDMKQPVRKYKAAASRRACKKRLSVVESQHDSVQKISLAVGAMAEDTLEELRLMSNKCETELRPTSPVHSREELVVSDDSSSDHTVNSGPSSPSRPVDNIRCRECERLFTKVRRWPSPNKKRRDKNPASLSCDMWILLKKRHPQRRRHREKGLLWTSLSHIRKMLAQGSGSSVINRTWMKCSRPHVFQQRILRRCKYLTSIQTDLSITRAKPRHRKRPRVVFPPVAGWNSSVKRRPSVNNTFLQKLSPFNLSVREAQEDELHAEDKFSKSNQKNSSNQKSANAKGKMRELEVCDGIDVTRRVLKFDGQLQTMERRKSPRQRHEHEEIHESQIELQDESSEDSDWFKTPTDLFSVKPKIKQGNQKKVSDPKPNAQKPNFMSLLATMVKKQNQIIRESCN
ncbi:uncharacterized protein si:ch211-227n13.3 [Danio aesculapii]|uniref:uncharacterized protein si:ch211-227n13.3 n=1 Tax=Danio aesculapii TaxID=1142201 RepID=UPI0024BF2076|nr:uncharacterized protein si:ch211-227n13.3 [Danio aesculapii]